jgi:hypothetical protein
MPSDNVIEFVSRAERSHMLFAAVIQPLARLIHAGRINPETVSREAFFDALRELGRSHDDAFEVYVTRVDEEMRLVAHCVAESEAKSGIVLLFTLLESEVNTLLRMHLRIRGFSPNTITDALRGTDFDAKLDVLLPLLDVSVPERVRNTALQCKAIRNLVVHNKATPALMADIGDKHSDTEIASERAERFFAENPVDRLKADLQDFVDTGIYESPDIQWGRHLLEKYYERGEV